MLNNFTLSKTDLNIVYVPVGGIPEHRVAEYIKTISEAKKNKFGEDYPTMFLAVTEIPTQVITIDENGKVEYSEVSKLEELMNKSGCSECD